ncbi:MAG: ABC transporter permease [Gammaproteobacteria bacterium]|nr:ABC transporter permease [Gammaproteobacteria bacterium]
MSYELIYYGLLQGMILGFVAFGMMVPFRLLAYSDLSAEGAYPLGGAVYTTMVLHGHSADMALVLSMVCGACLSMCSGCIAMRLNVHSLLAGILVSTMVYSLDLRLLGKPNVALFTFTVLENPLLKLFGGMIGLIMIIRYFLLTDYGLRFRAVGLHPRFSQAHGIKVSQQTYLGLGFAGMLYGFAGSLMVIMQQYMDVGMGMGIAIHGLAAMMIGEAMIGRETLTKQLMSPIIGAVIYQQVIGLVMAGGFEPSDLKLVTGCVVLVVLFCSNKRGLSC